MRTFKNIAILLALVATVALTGCTANKAPAAKGMSLMERFHSGKDLINESEADKNAPDDEKALGFLKRGEKFIQQGREELAFEQFSRAAALDPELMAARFRRGELLVARGMSEMALAEFQTVIKNMPEFAPAHEAAGIVYFKSSLYEEAQQYLIKALSIDPSLTRSYMHLGAIHNYNKHYDKALVAFTQAAKSAPGDGTIYNNIGITHSMMGDDESAIDAFRVAVRLGAPSARAYNNMGLALARLNRFEEALEAFRCAEGEAAAYNNLGYVYFLNGDYAKAVASFERAIDVEPTFYIRASENLKRARLALRFEQGDKVPTMPATGTIPELSDTPRIPASATGPLTEARKGPGPRLQHADPEKRPAPKLRIVSPKALPRPAATPEAPAQPIAPVSNASQIVGATVSVASTVSAPVTSVQHARPSKYTPNPVVVGPVYTLHVSSWRTIGSANREAGRLSKLGHEANIIHVRLPGKGDWYRVTLGTYYSLKEARVERTRLHESKKFKTVRIVRRSRHAHPDQTFRQVHNANTHA